MPPSPSFFEGEESNEETFSREPMQHPWVSDGEEFNVFQLLEESGREPEDFADEAASADEVSWYRQVQDQPEAGHAESACSWALPGDEDSALEALVGKLQRQESRPPFPLLPAVRFQGPGSVDPQINAWQVDALLFDVKRRRLDKPKQPWEAGPLSLKLPRVTSASEHLLRSRPTVGMADVLNPPVSSPLGAREPEPILAWVVESRLRHFRVERSDEDLRVLALTRIRTLVMLDPLASRLGRSLASEVENLATEDEISSSFSHAFAAKASSTIYKRSGSLCKFATWCMHRGVSPLRFGEVDLYRYMCSLQDSAGATSGSHLVEALRFLDGVVGLVHVAIEEILSSRCRGLAQAMHASKAPLKQKQPLTRSQIEDLETFCIRASSRHVCIAGQLLFCFHAASRWRDSQTLRHVDLEVDPTSGESLVFGEALTSKTTLTAKAKTTLLPYVGVGLGLSRQPWAEAWMKARSEEGLTGGDPFLPTFCERRGSWGSQRMSASEASIYLREFLQNMSGNYEDMASLGTHSMKRTLLSWAGKSHPIVFNHSERRLLGHHLDQENKSVVIYSKDSYVALYGKVLGMYSSIRSGLFDPDMKAATRMRVIARRLAQDEDLESPASPRTAGPAHDHRDDPVPEAAESEAGSLSSGSEAPEGELRVPGMLGARSPFLGVDLSACWTHKISGITHVIRDETTLMCGRFLSSNFVRTAEAGIAGANPECCHQCNRCLESH